jgi:hypothetical protein
MMTKFAAAKYDQELNKGIGTSKIMSGGLFPGLHGEDQCWA